MTKEPYACFLGIPHESLAIMRIHAFEVGIFLAMVAGLRVGDQTEVDGLDLAEHGECGYPGN